MANKITKREVINGLMNGTINITDDVAISYLKNELALLDKKSASKKASATQVANVGIKDTIVATLSANPKAMTVTEIQSANAELSELSNQKVSALLRQLVESGLVVKSTDKKKSYFSVA